MNWDAEFTAYVVQRRQHLYRAAYLLCGHPQRAEDIVQTALMKLYSAWNRAQTADSVDAYVRRIIVNSHLDETRRPWRRERVGHDIPDRSTSAEIALEDTDELWAALKALPARQRRVVVLRHYWGLSVDETAADLAVSAGTVKSQTSAALANLRSALVPDTQGEAR
jgi:RNA polymerase sigma-70 factor (sigma-E family)